MMKILIHGTGTQGRLLFAEMSDDGRYDVEAFVCDDKFYSPADFMGKPVYRASDIERHFPPGNLKVISTGVYASPRERYHSYLQMKEKGYQFINYISRKATVADNVVMGENNIIFSGVYLDFFGRLGNSNIIRPNTYIGHDFNIKDGVYIAPGCHIGGYSTIEDLSFIGIASTIIERVTIRQETLIGASSLVIRDTEAYSQYIGNPAKKVKTHQETGILL